MKFKPIKSALHKEKDFVTVRVLPFLQGRKTVINKWTLLVLLQHTCNKCFLYLKVGLDNLSNFNFNHNS